MILQLYKINSTPQSSLEVTKAERLERKFPLLPGLLGMQLQTFHAEFSL
jgi:hypothetical protein